MLRTLKVGLARAPNSNTSTALSLSGGFCSSTLMHLYHKALHSKQRGPSQKPPRTIAFHVVVPEELGGGGLNACDVAGGVARGLGIEFVELRIPEVVKENLEMMKNVTDRTDLTRGIVLDLVVGAAREYECRRVLLGVCATKVAGDVLMKTVTGHGTAVPSLVAKWVTGGYRDSAVRMTVVRPFRDVQVRHCVSYIRMVYPGFMPASPSEMSSGMVMGSLHGIVERFMADLARDNPGVIHNVVRTAEKLEKGERSGGSKSLCALCGFAVAKSYEANEDCKVNGTGVVDTADTGSEEVCVSSDCEGCSCAKRKKANLCYGCREAMRRSDAKDGNETVKNLVRWKTECTGLDLNRRQMKESIAEYLINED